MPEVFRAIEPFSLPERNGVSRTIRTGDLVSDDDPDFKGREHLFEPAIKAANRALETASAAPGERRSLGLGHKKASASGSASAKAPDAQPPAPATPPASTQKEGSTDA